jgi:hypothetical protein
LAKKKKKKNPFEMFLDDDEIEGFNYEGWEGLVSGEHDDDDGNEDGNDSIDDGNENNDEDE